jgi:predicted transcriptional regulator
MNTTKIIRSKRDKENPFTRMSNSIGNLKADEIGIMFQLLSNSDNWIINKDDVKRKSKLGERRFVRAWNHLKELGYIEIQKLPMKNGKFCYHYTIYEIPGVQNEGMDIKPEVHLGGTVNKTIPTIPGYGKPGLVNGGTNNYYTTKNNPNNPDGSNSPNKVKVRPDQDILDPLILGQEDINNDNLQIVPNSYYRYESVRDNESSQNEVPKTTISTKEKVMPDKLITSTKDCNTISNDTSTNTGTFDDFQKYFNSEWENIINEMIQKFDDSQRDKYKLLSKGEQEDYLRIYARKKWKSKQTEEPLIETSKEVLSGMYDITSTEIPEYEADENDIQVFTTVIDEMFKEDKLLNWKTLMRKNPLYKFNRLTSKIHKSIPELLAMIEIVYNKINMKQ